MLSQKALIDAFKALIYADELSDTLKTAIAGEAYDKMSIVEGNAEDKRKNAYSRKYYKDKIITKGMRTNGKEPDTLYSPRSLGEKETKRRNLLLAIKRTVAQQADGSTIVSIPYETLAAAIDEVLK